MSRPAIDRMLRPTTIAIVGLSDSNSRTIECLRPNFTSGCEVFIVNQRHERVMGRPAAKSLLDIGQPIDCVLSVIPAAASVSLAEEAVSLDVGGIIVIAGGFAETGPDGVRLQDRIRAAAAAGGMALMGPNTVGFENVHLGIRLAVAVREKHNIGGLSVISQSGAMTEGVTMTGNPIGAGFNLLISSGNEAVNDLADFVDYVANDPSTKAIGLVIEKIRRPAPFFAAIDRAIAAGKPVVAVKLGRNKRTQRMAASHTGSLVGDAWAYEVALRQHGVTMANDAEELAHRLTLIDKIPSERWSEVRALGVVTRTGGFASQTYDIAAQEGVNIPALDDFLPWIQQRIPGALVANPLDITGLGGAHWKEILEHFVNSPETDALYVPHPITEDEEHVRSLVGELVEIAESATKPVVLANISGVPPAWMAQYEGSALAFGNGVRPSLRGLDTIGRFIRYRNQARSSPRVPQQMSLQMPEVIGGKEPTIISFDATMKLLRRIGFPVLPYALIEPDADPRLEELGFAAPYVAKLADVPHRTDRNAVRLNVIKQRLGSEVDELRAIANAEGVSARVVVQPMVHGAGEVIIGVHGASELGPMVVFGLGGIFVEVLARIAGRLAPFDLSEANSLIDEFRDVGLMHGFRGRARWDLDQLAHLLCRAGQFAAAARDWIVSLDVNPLIYSENAYWVVDALLIVNGAGQTEAISR